MEIGHVGLGAEFSEQLGGSIGARQPRNFAIRVIQVAENHRRGRARLHAGGIEFAIFQLALFAFRLDLRGANALHAKGAFFHDADTAHGDVGIGDSDLGGRGVERRLRAGHEHHIDTPAAQLGGETEAADAREFGHAQVELVAQDRLLDGLKDHPGSPPRLDVWMSHGDHVAKAPPGFTVTARTDRIPVAAMANEEKRWYGVQKPPDCSSWRQTGSAFR